MSIKIHLGNTNVNPLYLAPKAKGFSQTAPALMNLATTSSGDTLIACEQVQYDGETPTTTCIEILQENGLYAGL